MVLENIISPENAENRPGLMIFLGFFYTSLAMLLSYLIFAQYSSIFMIFLATIASIPLVYNLMKMEEQKDITDIEEKVLLKEHSRALKAFMYLFIGATLSFTLWYVVLPSQTAGVLFQSQSATINSINGNAVFGVAKQVGGSSAVSVSGNAVGAGAILAKIFFNNLKVLLFCILFSFLYGAGAIFILIWNASIVGTAIGSFIKTSISSLVVSSCAPNAGTAFCAVSVGLSKYAIHGIPEILAYFIAALAGGIVSIAVINHDFASRKFEHILLDSADLLMLAIAVLLIAAFLEVYVTPSIGFDTSVYSSCIKTFSCALA